MSSIYNFSYSIIFKINNLNEQKIYILWQKVISAVTISCYDTKQNSNKTQHWGYSMLRHGTHCVTLSTLIWMLKGQIGNFESESWGAPIRRAGEAWWGEIPASSLGNDPFDSARLPLSGSTGIQSKRCAAAAAGSWARISSLFGQWRTASSALGPEGVKAHFRDLLEMWAWSPNKGHWHENLASIFFFPASWTSLQSKWNRYWTVCGIWDDLFVTIIPFR